MVGTTFRYKYPRYFQGRFVARIVRNFKALLRVMNKIFSSLKDYLAARPIRGGTGRIFPRPSWKSAQQVLWNLFLLAAGTAVCAAAINGILIPHRFVSGGFTGLALVIHYLAPAASVSLVYALLNIPLFLLGWFVVSRRFFLYSIVGVVFFIAAVAWIRVTIPVRDQLLAAMLAGLIVGFGSGVILRSLGSAGGGDILSVILYQRFSIRLGTTILTFNAVVLLLAAVLFPLERILYTLIYMYVTSRIVDVVVIGLSQRKSVFIVSPAWQAISKQVLQQLQRGVTILQGQGGYSAKEQKVLYTVITFRELAILKRLVRQEDPRAFVVVSDTTEVMGHRIGNQPQW